ncbi:hypothetical protein BC941DRAFT_352604 [Chlamydoabsidia padenii]|nr:hypothetical protein BC941DRAFT_352604 [Chlamydoabsidia padenii]
MYYIFNFDLLFLLSLNILISQQSVSDNQVFLSFEQYDFDGDDRFKAGVSSIMKKQEGDKDEMLEKAKWFYYTKFVQSFNYDHYQQWKTNKTKSIETSTTTTTADDDQVYVPPRLTFQEIVEMIETGQEIPGIRQIPNKLSKGTPSQPQLKARPKPWERGQQ